MIVSLPAKERLKRRNSKRKVPKVYYTSCQKRDGSKGWSGGPDLPSSAQYPAAFNTAILKVWVDHYKEEGQSVSPKV